MSACSRENRKGIGVEMFQWEIHRLSAFGKTAGVWKMPSTNSSGDLLNGELVQNAGMEQQDGMVLLVVCIVCGLAAAIMVFLAVRALLRNSRKKNSLKTGTAKQGAGIPLRLEIYSGKCRNKTTLLALSDVLTIGRDRGCDIVFDDPDMAPQNSRIRLSGDEVYIEDLDASRGTALNGMRIQGRNKLRGGEVISIGNVEFGIFFL